MIGVAHMPDIQKLCLYDAGHQEDAWALDRRRLMGGLIDFSIEKNKPSAQKTASEEAVAVKAVSGYAA